MARRPTLTDRSRRTSARRIAPGEWHRFVDLGRAAEDAGIDRIVVVDHVVMGPHTENYMWGKFPVPPDAPWLEPLTVLAAIAAVTTQVRLATGILIAPLRPAAFLAKQVATLDQMSAGRVDLGVGTGWQREEYDARGPVVRGTGSVARRHARRVPGAVARHAGGARLADLSFRRHLLHAQAGAAGRDTDLGRRHVARPEPGAGGRARRAAGSRSWARRSRASPRARARSARRFTAAGRDPSALQVQAPLRMAMGDDGRPDLAASMASVPDLVAAGATDVIVTLRAFSRDVAASPAAMVRIREQFDAFDAARETQSSGPCSHRSTTIRSTRRRCRSRTRPPATRTTTTGSGSTATPRTTTSPRAWPCTRTAASSTARSRWCTTACSVRCSRRAGFPADRGETRIGPLTIEIVEPLRITRVRADAADLGIDADVTFTARTVALEEPRQTLTAGTKTVMDSTRMTQWGTWSGRIIERRAANPARPRLRHQGPVVGRAARRRPDARRARADTLPQIFFLWAPINWDDCCTHFLCFERAQRRSVGGEPGRARPHRRRRSHVECRRTHPSPRGRDARGALGAGLRRSQGATCGS